MPSSHSATVTALTASVGFQEGFGGPLFATALVLALIVTISSLPLKQLGLLDRKVNCFIIQISKMFIFWQVMYDATGVRLQAGRQAEVLNQIVYELPAEHPLAESRPLRELLGHTPPQVMAGGLLGILTAVIGHLITVASS
ncbi:hypothetical protein Ahy_A03g010186 isoform A [Arachis hypogaea]|uniref:Uncharacterized protein n=1 Tax=Arachis hypogaea TaxID=3818 RepID=A0A445DLX7_ARAHY|nr:hypothetical protein Ahy_A03g010186 isoform A [Arachis hypogaea]